MSRNPRFFEVEQRLNRADVLTQQLQIGLINAHVAEHSPENQKNWPVKAKAIGTGIAAVIVGVITAGVQFNWWYVSKPSHHDTPVIPPSKYEERAPYGQRQRVTGD